MVLSRRKTIKESNVVKFLKIKELIVEKKWEFKIIQTNKIKSIIKLN